MPGLITNYYFAKDAIATLDEKYKTMFILNEKRVFLYSNFFNLPRYYNLDRTFSKSNDLYDIENRLLNMDFFEVINKFISTLQRTGYDKDNVLFLYSFVSAYVFNKHYSNYINLLLNAIENINDLTLKKAIDNLLFSEVEKKSLGKINIYQRFKGAYLFTFSNMEIINSMVSDTFKFALPETLFKNSVKSFKRISSNYGKSKKPLYSIIDSLSRKDKNKRRKNYFYNKSYPNLDYLNVNKIDFELSFEQMYDEAKQEASKLLDAVSNYLFYNNKKAFEKIFDLKVTKK